MNKMYIPNPQKWVKYYENMAKGYHNPFVDQKGGRTKQIGDSLSGSQGSFMIPIEETSTAANSHPTNHVKVELVSPSQQVVEQAKSELRAGINGIKRKNTSQFVSSAKRRPTVNTSQRKKQSQAKPKNTNKSKGKKTTKKLQKTAKQKKVTKPKKTAKPKKVTKPKKTAKPKKRPTAPAKQKRPVIKDIFNKHGST